MDINADFRARAVVHGGSTPWIPSPIAGVDRRMLDRIGDEVARATSIVRYAPGSRFSPHTHGGGEEILVLEGVFQDEHGDYPAGSYIRNPPRSSHSPAAALGAVILVKLWQFDPADRTSVRLDTSAVAPTASAVDGVAIVPLFQREGENVRLELWGPGKSVTIRDHDGFEAFVVEGGFEQGADLFVRHSWLRLPVDQDFEAVSGPEGARVWIKTGHLAAPVTAPLQGAV